MTPNPRPTSVDARSRRLLDIGKTRRYSRALHRDLQRLPSGTFRDELIAMAVES